MRLHKSWTYEDIANMTREQQLHSIEHFIANEDEDITFETEADLIAWQRKNGFR